MRLTIKRVSSWRDRLERASRTIANVNAEMREAKVAARGGDLSSVTELAMTVKAAAAAATLAAQHADEMLARTVRLKGGNDA